MARLSCDGARAAALVGLVALLACGDQPPPAPAQPIRFSHKVHAGDNQIGCQTCHAYAAQAPVAGIPSMARCQGCHRFVKQDPQHPSMDAELQPIVKVLAEGTAIQWARVYRLPDHVYFTHERHVRAGLRCQQCHGEVQTVDQVRQAAPLTMGWCVACHRARQKADPVKLAKLTDCWTCHK